MLRYRDNFWGTACAVALFSLMLEVFFSLDVRPREAEARKFRNLRRVLSQ